MYHSVIAQYAAPSSHTTFYFSGRGDIITGRVMVPQSYTYTYYETVGWSGKNGDGNGYGGIQDHPNGKCYIFSLWEPTTNSGATTADYVGPGTIVETFGGEGNGMKSMNFQIGWNLNEWVQLVTRNWQYTGRTFYGLWIKRSSNGKWYHMITFSYPISNLDFSTYNDLFIEDWLGTGQYLRKVLLKDVWQRDGNSRWAKPYSVRFSSNSNDSVRNGIYNESFNAGVENGSYFMETGGNTSHSFSGRTLTLPMIDQGISPQLSAGRVDSIQASYSAKRVTVRWAISDTCTPQFSYSMEVYNDTAGAPLYSASDTRPQVRQAIVNTSGLTPGVYFVRLRLKDIFDVEMPIAKTFFSVTAGGTGIEELQESPIELGLIQNYPNPFNPSTTIRYGLHKPAHVNLRIYNSLAQEVAALVNGEKNAGDYSVSWDASGAPSGVYFYRLQSGKFVKTKRMILLR
jgi:hypothetical protein